MEIEFNIIPTRYWRSTCCRTPVFFSKTWTAEIDPRLIAVAFCHKCGIQTSAKYQEAVDEFTDTIDIMQI